MIFLGSLLFSLIFSALLCQIAEVAVTIERVATSPIMSNLWSRYQNNYSYASEVT
jgi:hypothetical protein